MKRITASLLLLLAACASQPTASMTPTDYSDADTHITTLLDDFHDAAAQADEERYFAHFSEDAVFIGTDATERWPLATFKAYAMPHFQKESAWTYTAKSRNIHVDPARNAAWFDELLHNESYGQMQGSGVLVFEDDTWRIAKYVLSFAVPNEVAKDVVTRIQEG